MLLIPAIDLKNGKCVRLRQGKMDESTTFSEDPMAMAEHWRDLGCRRLHIVDLDGAFSGRPENHDLIENILSEMKGIPVQIGGGIRTREHLENYLSVGASGVVLGTKAVEQPDFLSEMASLFPAKILLGLDTRQGMIATHGWSTTESISALEFVDSIKHLPLAGIVYTDIERDGMMTGLNVQATLEIARRSDMPTIASGGINSLKDLQDLKKGFEFDSNLFFGAITGRAIYEGKLNFPAGQVFLDA